jgi:hypothetical protein
MGHLQALPEGPAHGAVTPWPGSRAVPPQLSEWREAELISELLDVTSDQELGQYLGQVISGTARAVGSFARSETGQALGRVLKSVAHLVLPTVGRPIGTRFGAPAGVDLGTAAAQRAGPLLGLELEGMSHEDREFEIARQFVKFAHAAAAEAAVRPAGAPGMPAARAAVGAAARRYAPGLVRLGPGPPPRGPTAGRWIRRGTAIVLIGM